MLGSLRASSGGSSTPTINATQTLTATSTIAITVNIASQVCPVTSAAAITLTSNPQIAAGSNGQRVTVQNNGSFTITLADANGLSLQGTLAIGATQFATFVNLGGFWQLEDTNGSPVWTSAPLTNSWANFGGSHQTAEYTKFRNEVLLRGFVSRNVAYTAPVVIFVLPTGFRPSLINRFPVDFASSGNAFIDIEATGNVLFGNLASPAPASQLASLAAIQFRV